MVQHMGREPLIDIDYINKTCVCKKMIHCISSSALVNSIQLESANN